MWSNHLKVFYGGTHECCKSYGSSKFHGGKCIYIFTILIIAWKYMLCGVMWDCLTLVFSPQMVLGILCPLVDGSIWCQDPKKARDVCEY